MKKLFLITLLCVFAFNLNAQDFGLTAGYTNLSTDGESWSGFNVGAFVDFSVSEKFSVQPELVYTSSKDEDVTYNLFNVNAMAKYHVSEEFSILAGPQFGFASGDIPDILDDAYGDDFTSLNLQFVVGIAYNFSENIFAQARYGFQLNEHVEDVVDAVNILSVGIGYSF